MIAIAFSLRHFFVSVCDAASLFWRQLHLHRYFAQVFVSAVCGGNQGRNDELLAFANFASCCS